MSESFNRFDRNIQRVDNLCNLFEQAKASPKRPTVKEADILRAAVVFLHSALEDYLRGILSDLLPQIGDEAAINGIALIDTQDRAEKFYMGKLLPYKDKTVASLISDSVRQHMKKVSFNDVTDIASWLKKISVSLNDFHDHDSVNTMIKRRHKIVHEADNNQNSGQGNHFAASINLQTVKAWETSVVNLVNSIEAQLVANGIGRE